MSNEYNTSKEIELIKKYQSTKDPMALMQLRRTFEGAINSAAMSAPTSGMNQELIKQKAYKGFARALNTYDPTKNVKPTTHITNVIRGFLQNENYDLQNKTRLSQNDTILQNQMYRAQVNLEMSGKEVTDDNLIEELKTIKTSKQEVTTDWLDKIRNSTRKELSGDKGVGTKDKGENITTMDIHNVDEETGEELYERQLMQERFQKAFSKLSPTEQGLVNDVDLSGKKMSWNQVALNNNYKSRYLAERAYGDASQRLSMLLKEDD